MKKKYVVGSIVCILLMLVSLIFFTSIGSADDLQEIKVPYYCTIGIAWVTKWNTYQYIPMCKDDAEELECVLVANKPNWHCGFDKNEQDVHQDQWEITDDQNYVDNVSFAYYAGHGSADKLVFKDVLGLPYDSARLNPDYCDWGDENGNKLKWVALACCLAGQNTHKALDGLHLICGWRTECDDAVYGRRFAEYLIAGYEIKTAWFLTGDELSPGGLMNVKGEDISVGSDHLYHCGTVNLTPINDEYYYEWTHST